MNKHISFTETTGVYKLNAAKKGGIYYCDGCSISISGSTFSFIYSIYGGVVYSIGDTQIIFTLSNITSSSAYYTGSFLEASTSESSVASTLSI